MSVTTAHMMWLSLFIIGNIPSLETTKIRKKSIILFASIVSLSGDINIL